MVYEHQYLRYQAEYRATHGAVDGERVLLYPDTPIVSQPHFIALAPRADRLGRLLVADPALRRREAELGYRVKTGDEFTAALERERIPVPPTVTDDKDDTNAVLPDAQVLDRVITTIKPSCPSLVPH